MSSPTKEDLSDVKFLLKQELSQAKKEMIVWMFSCFVVLALLIIGLYFK